ncbi:MAG: hypothetical protein NT034_04490, partial [Candidatus Magasanikbacteria bacterium]|nr:hypothetical protein [Candidatus Magasanikbacteria bacterium]
IHIAKVTGSNPVSSTNQIFFNMSQNILNSEVNIGDVQYEWNVNEYERHERSKNWYVAIGILGAILVGYGVVSGNYLFALITVLFGIILFMQDMVEPMEVYFALTNTGVVIGKKYYRYSELNNFWIIYNPPATKNLYFSQNSLLRHRVQVPLYDFDPRPIRDYLNQFLEEECFTIAQKTKLC